MKIRSKDELQDKIDDDIVRRKKEIIDLKGLLHKAKDRNQLLLAKCLVVLSYSHWEGFVKYATKCYLLYIKTKGLSSDKYSQPLRSSLFYRQIMKQPDSVPNKILLTEECLYNNYDLAIIEDDLCDTESNLDFSVLKKILYNIGIRTTVFDTKEIFINERIVGDRNKFAHGEIRPYTQKDAEDIADMVIVLMSQFKTEIENAVTLDSYLHH